MKDLHLLVAALGIGLGMTILLLVRRDHLYIRHGLFWMAVASVSVVLGIWPNLIDRLGAMTGVAYPPSLLFLLALIMLIVRAVMVDIAFTRLRREVRLLNQQIALTRPSDASQSKTFDPQDETETAEANGASRVTR